MQRDDYQVRRKAAQQRFAAATAFLESSQAEENRERQDEQSRRQATLRVRRLLAVAFIALAVVIGVSSCLYYLWNDSWEQHQRAQEQRGLAEHNLAAALTMVSQLTDKIASKVRERELNVEVAKGLIDAVTVGLRNIDTTKSDQRFTADALLLESKISDSLSEIHLVGGNLKEACELAEQQYRFVALGEKIDPDPSKWKHARARSFLRIGNALVEKGDLDKPQASEPGSTAVCQTSSELPRDATTAYEALLVTMEELQQRDGDRTNREWQRDLSTAYDRIGDLNEALGNLKAARGWYDKRLHHALNLPDSYRLDPEWRWVQAVSHLNIGDMLLAIDSQKDAEKANDEFDRLIAALDGIPSEAETPRRLWTRALGHERRGDVQMIFGDRKKRENAIDQAKKHYEEASDQYDKFFKIAEALVGKDDDSADWRRGLAIARERQGDAALALDRPRTDDWDPTSPRNRYENNRGTALLLIEKNPANKTFERDWAISEGKLGDALRASGNLKEALAQYQLFRTLAEALAKADPRNADWQRDLAVSHQKIGDMLLASEQHASAHQAFKSCNEVLNQHAGRMKSYDPRNRWPEDDPQYCLKKANEVEKLLAQTPSGRG